MFGDRKTVVLRGGAPWGFRLSGGGQTSVYIAKVRSRSKAASGGLAAGDTLVSINGISALQQSLREINDIIDTIRDQLILEVQCSTHSRGFRLDSSSSIDTRENSPVRTIHRITPQPKPSEFSSNRTSPLPALFRTATITASPPTMTTTARFQPFTSRTTTSNTTYDTPRNYNNSMTSGYLSDTNDLRRSSISLRPLIQQTSATTTSTTTMTTPKAYNVKISTQSNEPNYYSDSEYVTSGPRYYKISRQVNSPRRPSNVVLPIRSMTSKAYEPYVPPPPEPIVIARVNPPPKLSFPNEESSRNTFEHELGAELLKSPIANKKRYADSSFFRTPFNTYPTIDDQKNMARKIASILEGGDPTQKGSTKFEKQRQRAEKYSLETEKIPSAPITNQSYRPLRPLQTHDAFYSSAKPIPNCIKHSLEEAQYINPLRYVGAPEEFKQIHLQEHVTHTHVPPQAAMNLVADLNSSVGKGAALFQKRKARSEKWIIDENNVKKQGYQPTTNYPAPNSKPWGQRAPASWSDSEGISQVSPSPPPLQPQPMPSTRSPLYSSSAPIFPESVSPSVPRFGDFNAKPKGFASWNAESTARSQSPRAPIDTRKPLNLNIEPSIREGIAESHTRSASQPWSPPVTNPYFAYPPTTSHPISHDGIDHLRQRLTQHQPTQVPSSFDQYYKPTRPSPVPILNSYASSQHFTDL